jgi:hypothetical protein
MIGIPIVFKKRVPTGAKNKLNEPVYSEDTFTIQNCLVAPLQAPIDRAESSALDRNMTVVRIHLPKSDSTDVSNCTFDYGGQTWTVIGTPPPFMPENTPTDWNRYASAESVNG